jgi:hypothetical protein
MKTDYQQEIENLIANAFIPAAPEDKTALPKTLEEIHAMVINVLPAKWIYDTDVYSALENLGFKVSYGKKDEEPGLFYFVIVK